MGLILHKVSLKFAVRLADEQCLLVLRSISEVWAPFLDLVVTLLGRNRHLAESFFLVTKKVI